MASVVRKKGGDVFGEPFWLPVQADCTVGCEVSYIFSSSVPIDCVVYLRKALSLSPQRNNKKHSLKKIPTKDILQMKAKAILKSSGITESRNRFSSKSSASAVGKLTMSTKRDSLFSNDRRFRMRTEAGRLITINSDGTANEGGLTDIYLNQQSSLADSDQYMLDINQHHSPTAYQTYEFPQFQSATQSTEKTNGPRILGGPLEGQPFLIPNFSIVLPNTRVTSDLFEYQLSQTSPQTIADGDDMNISGLAQLSDTTEGDDKNSILYDLHRGLDSDGSSMVSYSAENDETPLEITDQNWRNTPLDISQLVVDRGSLPVQYRTRNTPEQLQATSYTHLVAAVAHGSPPNNLRLRQNDTDSGDIRSNIDKTKMHRKPYQKNPLMQLTSSNLPAESNVENKIPEVNRIVEQARIANGRNVVNAQILQPTFPTSTNNRGDSAFELKRIVHHMSTNIQHQHHTNEG
ncbi:unnamed protein product [Anisakis simplex]|uniref:Uncharacterized protein n=1 Tax=Anisakis simplex TaxID=6269 RepID=A0A0M3JXP5_ANISI|nr:unnamed protein product [Anisakis simplex]